MEEENESADMSNAIVDSLKDRDFNDDGIPDMYLVTGSDGKKHFAWDSPEAKAVWDKYIRYCKKEKTYFLDHAAVMVDILKEMRKQRKLMEDRQGVEERKCDELRFVREAMKSLAKIIEEKKLSIF